MRAGQRRHSEGQGPYTHRSWEEAEQGHVEDRPGDHRLKRGGRKLGPPSLSGLLWEKQDRAGRGSGLANSNYFKGPWSNRHGPLVAWHLALG